MIFPLDAHQADTLRLGGVLEGGARKGKRLPNDRKETCNGCGQLVKINKACDLHLCIDCCSESTKPCRPHKKVKRLGVQGPYLQTSLAKPVNGFSAVLPGVLEKVEDAIKQRHSVYISYAGGTGGMRPRKIDPQVIEIGRDGQKVESYCHLAKGTRHFYLHKIHRIDDHDWVCDAETTVHQGLFICVLSYMPVFY